MEYIKNMVKEYIERYEKDVEIDLMLDALTLEEKLKTKAHLWHKWLGYRVQHSVIISELNDKLDGVFTEKFEEDKKRNPKMSDNSRKFKIKGYKELRDIKKEIEDQEIIVKYLYEVCEIMKSFQYSVNDFFQYTKYLDGYSG